MHDFVELILNLLQKAGALAVIAAGLCVLGILAAYVIFRCVTKGKKKFPWGKTVLLVLLVGYVVILLYATIFRFPHGGFRDSSLHLFRGWREAWTSFTRKLGRAMSVCSAVLKSSASWSVTATWAYERLTDRNTMD